MEHKHITKTAAVTLKAADGEHEAPGTFEAIVAVFSNVDSDGDMVAKGAFADHISKNPYPPIVWSHQWATPPIGVTLSYSETEIGLLVKGRLFVEEGNELAKQVYTAMTAKGGDGRPALREFSFGATVLDWHVEDQDGKSVTVFDSLDLHEYGPCLVGANPQTALLSIKHAHIDSATVEHQTHEVVTDPAGNGRAVALTASEKQRITALFI